MTDKHLTALIDQCSSETPLGRLSGPERDAVFAWLLDGEHVTRTGKPITRPRQMPRATGHKADGSPVFPAGSDFTPTETIEMVTK